MDQEGPIIGDEGARQEVMGVVWRGGCACVVHGHKRRRGSKRDKPPGSPIKCYCSGSKKEKLKKAYAMHSAIRHSQAKRGR